MKNLSVRRLYEDNKEICQLNPLTQDYGEQRYIVCEDISRPGLFLAGYTEYFPNQRVQVLGLEEIGFLRTLNKEKLRKVSDMLMSSGIPTLIVTHSQVPPDIVLETAKMYKVPVLQTPLHTTALIRKISNYLAWELAPSQTVHGTLVSVFDVGILITGPSGIGKSECALDLVSRGHVMVADDLVLIKHFPPGQLNGMSAAKDPNLRHYLEIRGIGLLDIQRMFGIRSVRDSHQIDINIELFLWNKGTQPERIGLQKKTKKVLGVDLPYIELPINPGKNIGVIIESIALDFNLKLKGINMAKDFNSILRKQLKTHEDKET